jgi:hypothetical protein
VDEIEEWQGRMSMFWSVDDNGVPHEWHGEPIAWSRWMWQEKREGGLCAVGRAEWPDGTRVSTMFLGTDMAFGMGPALLWELMIFGPRYDDDRPQERFTSQREALNAHQAWVERVMRQQNAVPAYRDEWIPPEYRLTAGMSRLTMGSLGAEEAPVASGEEHARGDDDGHDSPELQPGGGDGEIRGPGAGPGVRHSGA